MEVLLGLCSGPQFTTLWVFRSGIHYTFDSRVYVFQLLGGLCKGRSMFHREVSELWRAPTPWGLESKQLAQLLVSNSFVAGKKTMSHRLAEEDLGFLKRSLT